MRLQYLDQLVAVTYLRHVERHILKGNPARLISVRLDSIDAALPKAFVDDYASDLAKSLLRMVQHIMCGNPYIGLLAAKLLLISAFLVEFAALLFILAAGFGDVLAARLRPSDAFQVETHLR